MIQLKTVARRNVMALAITACLTMGAVSVSVAGTPQMADQATGDSQQPATDTWITTKVKTELATTDNVPAADVSVDTVNGVVHLTGNTESNMERKKAIAAAKSVKGVKSVDASGLKVGSTRASSNTSASMKMHGDMANGSKADSEQPVTDTWITTKVKTELATTDDVSALDVGVDTVNGAVHLSGNANSEIERKKAIAAAKSVKGVKSVDASALKVGKSAGSTDTTAQMKTTGDMTADSGQPVTDTWISTKVKAELAKTKNVDDMGISVDTVNGVVHLTGATGSDMQRKKSIAAAKSVKGVKSVDASGLKVSSTDASAHTSTPSKMNSDTIDHESNSGSQQPVTDTWITTKVKGELATTDDVSGMHVSVDTINGIVHLTGNVGSSAERTKAIASARSVKGVKSVDASGLKSANKTASADPDEADGGSQQPVTDTWITTKVKAELATADNVPGSVISVDTVNGVVHLIGNVGSNVERDRAIAAARSVKGVMKVDATDLKAAK